MNAAVSAHCCCPTHCPSLIAARRPWPQRLREGMQAAAGRLLTAARREPDPDPLAALDARALRDIGWCCEATPRPPRPGALPDLW